MSLSRGVRAGRQPGDILMITAGTRRPTRRAGTDPHLYCANWTWGAGLVQAQLPRHRDGRRRHPPAALGMSVVLRTAAELLFTETNPIPPATLEHRRPGYYWYAFLERHRRGHAIGAIRPASAPCRFWFLDVAGGANRMYRLLLRGAPREPLRDFRHWMSRGAPKAR